MSMGTNATQVQSILESLFLSAIQKMTTEGKGNFISDIYVQADPELTAMSLSAIMRLSPSM